MKPFEWGLPGGARLCGLLHEPSDRMPGYERRPAVIVVPGGAYRFCSPREGDPVALAFAAAGYQVFTLWYSTGDGAKNWQPMIELARCLVYLRAHAAELWLLPDKIAVCGFSAGGHLAACSGLLWDAPAVQAAVPAPQGQNRPDAMILCYPVITAGPFAHAESIQNIAGEDAALRRIFSLENQVRPDTPPVFLWHTVTDPSVPVQNSLMLAQALAASGVPFEAHFFGHGGHGTSVCTAEVGTEDAHNAAWLPLCLEWLGEKFDYRH